MTHDEQRFVDFRAIINAEMRRVEDVLAARVQILQVEIDRLKARVTQLEQQQPPMDAVSQTRLPR